MKRYGNLFARICAPDNLRLAADNAAKGKRQRDEVTKFFANLDENLEQLRRERLRLQNGDAELKAAITNVSHDLRTPLTAICGYLELLEREPHTDQSKRYLSVIRERTETMRTLTEELLQ